MLFLKKLLIYLSVSTAVFGAESNLKECLEVREIVTNNFGSITCAESYSHFNAKAYSYKYSKNKALKQKNVRIASFNAYQVGTVGTEFKDYEIVAKIINNWDVISVIELLPNIGVYKKHNEALMEYYQNLSNELTISSSIRRTQISTEIAKIRKSYELPGYMKILSELRKIDKSWALVLSGQKEGTDGATFKELTGFFYRSSVVKPSRNRYCELTTPHQQPYACTVKFEKDFYGKDVSDLIARRPFIGSFESGNFDFALLASHLIYNEPSSEELSKRIVQAAFNVDHYSKIGPGVTKKKFARFAELKHTLDFVVKFKNMFNENDVIIQGDFNLESDNEYWPDFLKDYQNLSLKIEGPTSLSRARELSDGTLTHGVGKNFDHFLFDEYETEECSGKRNARTYNFLENSMRNLIDNKYLVRSNESYDDGDLIRYEISKAGRTKVNTLVSELKVNLSGLYAPKKGKLVPRYNINDKVQDLMDKLIEPQLFDRTYYRHYLEVVSDHLPIYMTCSNMRDLD